MNIADEAVRKALQHLQQAAGQPIDRNNLGQLAQMHTWCQTVALEEQGGLDQAGRQLCTTMAVFLEGVILNEAADPQTGLQLLAGALESITQRIAGANVELDALIEQFRVCSGLGNSPAPAAAAPPAPPQAPAAPVAVVAAVPTASTPTEPPAAPPPPAATRGEGPAIDAYVSEPLLVDLNEREHLMGFIDESREHMDTIEVALLEMESDPGNPDKVNELFRPFHTIKGIAGFLNLRDINRLTHEVETILDLGRKGAMTISARITNLIFAAIDFLKQQIEQLNQFLQNPTGDAVPQPDITAIMQQLRLAAAGKLPEEATVRPAAQAAPPSTASVSTPAAKTEADPEADGSPAATSPTSKSSVDTSIRVDTLKLDALVDAVGELVIAQTMVNLNDAVRSNEKLNRDVSQVTKIVRDIQATALSMRMVPIGQTFQKMRRLVRDVAQKAGKQVELIISGEETEVDKTVIQQISDPLVHMVRNAVDHGVEPPDVRQSKGKPLVGRVWLDAFHQGDSIVIQVRDDGRGLDRNKLLAKAVERGIVQPEEQLTDPQVYSLVFAAGFSTAEVVTDISGRGVGMDVVKRNIDQLRGKIDISSTLGEGSSFNIRLPLTLAIIDGMLVRVGRERLIIPTIVIEQSLRPERQHLITVQRRSQMIQVRGQLCPLVQLSQLFGYGSYTDPCDGLVVIVHAEGARIGLVVDELIGQQQVVIKTLGERFKCVQGISGAAILGDGRVGLILEPAGLKALFAHSATQIEDFAAQRRMLQAAAESVSTEEPVDDTAGELVSAGAF